MKNDNEDYNEDNDYILLSSGYSIPDTVLRALHACSHLITQQLCERACVLSVRILQMKNTRAQLSWINCPSSNGSPAKGLSFDSSWV